MQLTMAIYEQPLSIMIQPQKVVNLVRSLFCIKLLIKLIDQLKTLNTRIILRFYLVILIN